MVVQEMKERQARDLRNFRHVKKSDLVAAQKIARERLIAAKILSADGALSTRYR